MYRKDCKTFFIALVAIVSSGANAQTVSVWPTAVVTTEDITLGDLCSLSGFSVEQRPKLQSFVVQKSPPAGGSTSIDVSEIQAAVRQAGANLATVLITGATRCEVSRPKKLANARRNADRVTPLAAATSTLGDAVRRVFAEGAAMYGGTVDLQFARTSGHLLRLAEPEYTFKVRVRGGRYVGRMIKVDVDVFRSGEFARSVPLAVNATITKSVVVAERPINLKAPVRLEDVGLSERTYDDPKRIPTSTFDSVVGQRARRFIPTGTPITLDDLELVPLVERGQLVDVISSVGGVYVRSAAKATGSGSLGDTVELRFGGSRGSVLSGIVAGHRRVHLGGAGS
jgi:flagella basal body P-ring formation protein FlgA